jgi:hypothetical protein
VPTVIGKIKGVMVMCYNKEIDSCFRICEIIRVKIKKVLTLFGLRNTQSCKRCGIDQNIVWGVKDEIWNRLHKDLSSKSLCLECFAKYVGGLKKEDLTIFETISDKEIIPEIGKRMRNSKERMISSNIFKPEHQKIWKKD